VGLAKMLERENRLAEAYGYLLPLVSKAAVDDYTLITFAQVCTSLGRANEAIAPLEKMLERQDLRRRNMSTIHFTLGKLYDNQGGYDQAFLHFTRGNALENKKFNPSMYKERIEKTIRTYSSTIMQNAPCATNRSEVPVFIIAMPRSGTSLVEQILSSHPQVYGAGETGDIISYSEHLQPLINNGEITTERLDEFAEKHIEKIRSLSNNARRVTDKTVNSFMDIGLIQLMFPKARIIHCMRNPLDTCLSCYFTQFGAGHLYSCDLNNLAIYYRQYHRIMEHWKRVSGLKILDVHYEELVHDLEAGAQSMIQFLGLDWDSNCLDFHNADRQVDTYSYDQVRQSVYTSSANRWKNYEKQIGALKNSLADLEYGLE
jgi:tetratricopeptide (TPR) repeat protein